MRDCPWALTEFYRPSIVFKVLVKPKKTLKISPKTKPQKKLQILENFQNLNNKKKLKKIGASRRKT